MANYRSGQVRVVNGSLPVQHIWRISYTSMSGTFGPLDSVVTWGEDQTATITGATQANPVVVTAAGHGFSPSDDIKITGVVGMTEINSIVFAVGAVTTDTFELAGINGTGYTAYTSGGTATLEGTGSGGIVDDDTSLDLLRFYRIAGTLPIIGDKLRQVSGASAIIEDIYPGSPPRFASNVESGDLFLVPGSTIPSIVSATIEDDAFSLTQAFAGTSQIGAYGVVKDQTAFFGFPKPTPGPGLQNEIVANALDQIDLRVKEIANVEQSLGSTSGAITVDWTLGHGALFTLTENVTSISFTNPRGPALLFIHLKQDGTGGRTVTGWPGTMVFTDDPIIDLRANAATVILIMFDGTNYLPAVLYPQPQYPTQPATGTWTGSTTIDWNDGFMQRGVLTGNTVFVFTAPQGCANMVLRWQQDGSGSHTVTWPGTVKWADGTEPTWDTAASDYNVAWLYYDVTAGYYYAYGYDFQ